MKMRAALKTIAGDYEVREVDLLSPSPGEVLTKVRSSGICGSDLRSWKIPRRDLVGRIMGHEFAGEVIEVDSDVTNVDGGDRVGVEPLIGCGRCYWCRIGQYNLCPELSRLRQVSTGFDEYSKGPGSKFHKLPSTVSFDEAALLDCLSVGVHATHRTKVETGNSVAVLGDGPIRLAATAVALAIGAEVYCIGHHDRSILVSQRGWVLFRSLIAWRKILSS
jgi:L-iditol 2-dehydrogenase